MIMEELTKWYQKHRGSKAENDQSYLRIVVNYIWQLSQNNKR